MIGWASIGEAPVINETDLPIDYGGNDPFELHTANSAPGASGSGCLMALLCAFVHTGLVLPHPAFRLTNYWVIRHDRHHYKHVNTNFAQIFPCWDMMFRTHKLD